MMDEFTTNVMIVLSVAMNLVEFLSFIFHFVGVPLKAITYKFHSCH